MADDLSCLGLGRIEMFISVAHYGNLKDASIELNVVPSTVSKNISQLEKDIGVTLFTRDKQHMVLTPVGEYLLQEWEDLTEKFQDSVETARRQQYRQRLNLVIGLQNSLKYDDLFTALRMVREENPGLNYTFINDNSYSLIGKFNDDKLDMAVVCEKDLPMVTGGNVCHKAVSQSRLYVFFSKNHELYDSLKGREEASLEEIKDYPFISVRHEGLPFYNDILIQISRDFDFPLKIADTVGNTEEMNDYLKLGAALLLAPSYIDVSGDGIERIPVKGLDSYSGPQIILWHQNSLQISVILQIVQSIA